MTTYRERKEAGLYSGDEKTAEKARADEAKEQQDRIKAAQRTAQGTEGTANPR